MNELDNIKKQLNDINTSRVRVQTLIEQAKNQCELIQQKYNVKSIDELKVLMDKAQQDYEIELNNVKQYIQETNEKLAQYSGLL